MTKDVIICPLFYTYKSKSKAFPILFDPQFIIRIFYVSTDKQMSSRKPKISSLKHPNTSSILKAGVEWLVHQRELQRHAQSDIRHRKEATVHPVKHDINMRVNMASERCITAYICLTVCFSINIKHQCTLIFFSERSNLFMTHIYLFKQKQRAGFRQATVSSRLRVNHPPKKERSVPWKPTSPHSPLQR